MRIPSGEGNRVQEGKWIENHLAFKAVKNFPLLSDLTWIDTSREREPEKHRCSFESKEK